MRKRRFFKEGLVFDCIVNTTIISVFVLSLSLVVIEVKGDNGKSSEMNTDFSDFASEVFVTDTAPKTEPEMITDDKVYETTVRPPEIESVPITTFAVVTTHSSPVTTTENPEETTTQPPVTTEPEVQNSLVSLGTLKLTAYCSCSKCCGEWAENRPVDKNGNEIILTASGKEAKAGFTIAADANRFPFGTRVYIYGNEYEVQDRGGAVKGNVIDIYFDDHDDALEFGCQYAEVFMKASK